MRPNYNINMEMLMLRSEIMGTLKGQNIKNIYA